MEPATHTMPTSDARMDVKSPITYVVPILGIDFPSSHIQVKYWALGNETWGPWQVEQMTKEAYAHKALQWAKG